MAKRITKTLSEKRARAGALGGRVKTRKGFGSLPAKKRAEMSRKGRAAIKKLIAEAKKKELPNPVAAKAAATKKKKEKESRNVDNTPL